MPSSKSPRKGSLQFWPRKRAEKFLPRANWDAVNNNSVKNLKGFIGYKVGMVSIHAKDNTPDSMMKGKVVSLPVTVIECPPMKIVSVRFYKYGKVLTEVLSENLEKELKRVIKLPKVKSKKTLDEVKDYDNITVLVASQAKKTEIKKTPDLSEIGLTGSLEDKLKFVKENLGKEINVSSVFEKGQLVDMRGVTTGRGLQGPVKRFGITLKSHKSEKGVRRAGSLGPWHPARTTFRVSMAGQHGLHTRLVYNSKIFDVGVGKDNANLMHIKNYGNVNTNYIIVNGSVQGPSKRQILITHALRPTKKQSKKNMEMVKIIR